MGLALLGVGLAETLVHVDLATGRSGHSGVGWLYEGSSAGARNLLATIASSTITVAASVFSITIAALSFAAGQMGPRLLRNFTQDRVNQVSLGIFAGTFAYSLTVLRTVRSPDEGDFIPHLSATVAMLLALLSVGTLVLFVAHLAGRIDIDTVIDLVQSDVHLALERTLRAMPDSPPLPEDTWTGASPVRLERHGYVQHVDRSRLARWAAAGNARIRLDLRPGDYLFPGSVVAHIVPSLVGAESAVDACLDLGPAPTASAALEPSIHQLVDVAVRALSPSVNDPRTALVVIDHLGSVLSRLSGQSLPSNVESVDGRVALVLPPTRYPDLLESMLGLIRHYGGDSPAVLLRALEVLAIVVEREPDPDRRQALSEQARRLLATGERTLGDADRGAVLAKYASVLAALHT